MRRIVAAVAATAAVWLCAGTSPAGAAEEGAAGTAVAPEKAETRSAPPDAAPVPADKPSRAPAPAVDGPADTAQPAVAEADAAPATAEAESAAITATPAPEGLQDRVGPVLGTDTDGTVVLYGGVTPDENPGGTLLADTWTWDGTNWVPRCGTTSPGAAGPCGPGPRTLGSTATGPTGLVMYGGADGWPFFGGPSGLTTAFGDMWLWTGTSWQLVCGLGDCAPGPRAGSAMAGNGLLALLFGGITGFDPVTGDPTGADDDTWAFDGTAWTQLCGLSIGLACGPSVRTGSMMGWDGSRFVLFGGVSFDTGFMADTWIFNGLTWDLFCDACGPDARMFGSVATIPGAGPSNPGLLLTGGLQFTGDDESEQITLFADLWHWNGAWNELASPWPERVVWDPESGPPPLGTSYMPALASAPNQCAVLAFTAEPDPATEGAFNETVLLDLPGGYPCGDGGGANGGDGDDSVVRVASVLPVTGRDWARAALLAAALLAAGALLLGLADLRSRRHHV